MEDIMDMDELLEAQNEEIKEMIHRLIAWLKSKNTSAEDIIDCIEHITK